MKRKSILAPLLCIILTGSFVFTGTTYVLADTFPPPSPYKIVLGNGNLVFYMTPQWPWDTTSTTQPASGLYYNTDPPVQIYDVWGYFYQYSWNWQSIYLSNDGIYFVYFPWTPSTAEGMWGWQSPGNTSSGLGGEAIGFYKNGSLIKLYSAGDLLKDRTKALFTVSHVLWENTEKREFNAKKNVLVSQP